MLCSSVFMMVPLYFLGMRSWVSIMQIPFIHLKEGRKNKRSETGTNSAVRFLLMEDSMFPPPKKKEEERKNQKYSLEKMEQRHD